MAETVLVTGASGFIGRSLVRRLARSGLKVRCLLRGGSAAPVPIGPDIELVRGDLTEPASLAPAAAGAAAVWHLGALIRPPRLLISRAELASDFNAVNAAGTENVARAAAAAGVKRFIHFSSIAAAGPGMNLKEDAEPRPLTFYGRSKLDGELALKRVAAETGLDFIILRPAMIYGPGARRWESLFSLIRTRLVPVAGSGENTVSVCYLETLLDAALLAAEKGAPGSVFNISEGALKVNDLVPLLAGLMGIKPLLVHVPEKLCGAAVRLADTCLSVSGLASPALNLLADYPCFKEAVSNWSHDTSRLRVLGWEPALTTAEAFARTLKGTGL